jgi:hypothetical protein
MRLPRRVANGRGRAPDAPWRLDGAPLQVAAPWLLALSIALLLTWLSVGPLGIGLSNNGDGWRLLRRAWAVDPLVGQPHPLADVYDMAPWTFDNLAQGLPRSTSGIVFFMVAALSQVFGETRFHLPLVTLVYHLVYASGLIRWVQTARSRGERAASLILWGGLLLSPYTLSVFHSVLEEAAFVALLPWWTCLLRQVWREGPGQSQGRGHDLTAFIVLSLGVLLAKPQTAILLPLVLGVLWRSRGRAVLWPAMGLVISVSLLAYRSQAQHAPFNGFNRLSGVAASLAGVSTWPERDFEARRAASAGRVHADDLRQLGLPDIMGPAWGQSFWPYCAPQVQAGCDAGSAEGQTLNFLRILARHPAALWASVHEAWWTAVNADYSMGYITMQNGRLVRPGDTPLFQRLMSCAGALWWALLALTLWSGLRRQLLPLALGLTLLCTPTVVVLGDGFYEFERHLLPYLALLPGMAALLLPVARTRAQARPAQHNQTHHPLTEVDHDAREAA